MLMKPRYIMPKNRYIYIYIYKNLEHTNRYGKVKKNLSLKFKIIKLKKKIAIDYAPTLPYAFCENLPSLLSFKYERVNHKTAQP